MTPREIEFVVKQERRLCKGGHELGYFHRWDDTPPGGVEAVVEFPDGVRRVLLGDIAFCDEENADLRRMNEYHRMELMPNQPGD